MWTEKSGLIGIGYEGTTPAELVDSLRGWGVSTLVDVRLNAISRKAGFSKKSLAATLEAGGIRYLHLPDLGNPRENREAYGELDSPEARGARTTFRNRLSEPGPAAALHQLVDLATQEHVAVFCYERSELHCHRQQVLRAARDKLDLVVV